MSNPSFENASGTDYAIIGCAFGGVWLYLGATRAHFESRDAAISWLINEATRARFEADAALVYSCKLDTLVKRECE